MEAGIGAEPAESLAERQPLREAIQRCVDSLGEPGKTMIETYFYEGGGYRRVAKRTGMSRMSAHRRMPAVVKRLTQLLLDDPLIRSRVRYSQEEE